MDNIDTDNMRKIIILLLLSSVAFGQTRPINGNGTSGKIPLWQNSQVITNSNLYQSGTQLGVNTVTPDASAAVDITSTTQGFLLPRLTTTQMNSITSPATGLMIFNISKDSVCYYNGSTWYGLSKGVGTVTSVGSGYGLTGGPITSFGTLVADTTVLESQTRAGKQFIPYKNAIGSADLGSYNLTATGLIAKSTVSAGTQGSIVGQLKLATGSNTSGITIQGAASGGFLQHTFTWPYAQGSTGQFLQATDNAGTLGWANAGTMSSWVTGYGLSGGTITDGATAKADTTVLESQTRAGKQFIPYKNAIGSADLGSYNLSGSTLTATYNLVTGKSLSSYGALTFYNTDNSNYIQINSPSSPTSYKMYLPTSQGSANQVMKNDGSGNLSWYSPTNGTVTSVGLSMPSIFTVSNSPVTTSGTLTAALNSQTQNLVLASPNGSSGTPTFRSLVSADLPALNYAYLSGGTSANIPFYATSGKLRFNSSFTFDTTNTILLTPKIAGGNLAGSTLRLQSTSSNAASGDYITFGVNNGNFGKLYKNGTVFFGGNVGDNNNVDGDIGIGYNVLKSATTQGQNIAIGWRAMEYSNATTRYNIGIGQYACQTVSGLFGNTAIGHGNLQSLTANGSGTYNLALGYGCAEAITLGGTNTIVGGINSGNNITTGSDNVTLGAYSTPSGNWSNSISIGYQAQAPASNTIQLGNSSITDLYSNANIHIQGIGNGLSYHTGSTNDLAGTVALHAGEALITIAGLTTSDKAFVQLTFANGDPSGVQYEVYCGPNILDIRAVDINNSTVTTDESNLYYFIVKSTN